MVVIEDLISTGGSVLEACEAAAREGQMFWGWQRSLPMNCRRIKQL